MAKQIGIKYTAPSGGFWEVPGVLHRGETGTYRVLGEMTEADTQRNLIKKYGLEIPSVPLLLAVATKGYNLRGKNPKEAETLRAFLQAGFRKHPNTSTRVIYNPLEDDELIHNYNTPEQCSSKEKIIGPDGWIIGISDKKVLESLLGRSDVSKINQVSQWVNGADFYVWRLNSKPSKKEERVVRFDADSGWLSLGCNGDPFDGYPAFRVLRID